MPKWLNGESHSKKARRSEKKFAKKVNGKTYLNSGATFGENDVTNDTFDFEHKRTESKQFTVKRDTLEKLYRRTPDTKVPLLIIEFGDGVQVAVIKYSDLEYLIDG